MNFHPLLLRQLKKEGVDPHAKELEPLMERINKTYHDHDSDRYTAQRAIEISSKEMRELRKRLDEERTYLQSIISEGLCIFNSQWVMTNCNATAKHILKIPDLNLIHLNFNSLNFFQDENLSTPLHLSDIINTLLQGKEFKASKVYFKDSHEKPVPLSLSLNPLPFHEGNFKGAILVIKDISEMCQFERSLQDALDEAYQSNEAKTLFLANISHELRTPMNAIMGYLQLLNNSDLSPLQLSHLKLAQESTHQLLELVNDVLDFATIDSEQFSVHPQECDLTDFLNSIDETYQLQCDNKDIHFTMNVAPDVPHHVYLDIKRFRQVFCNLLENALKFTPSSGTICVQVNPSKTQEEVLDVMVSDTGIGIGPKDLDKVFEVFYQCEQGTNRQYGGTGLGLSICKQLVEKMGGHIWVESTLQMGSTFYFTVPYKQKHDKLENTDDHKTLKESSQSLILVVDDNATNLHVTKELLEISDYQVITAAGAQEALEHLEKEKVDLIFMDCHMPGMDGFELTQHIRQKELNKGIKKQQEGYTKIIALTADAFESAKEKCFSVGMDGYVTKPFQLSDLQAAINKELNQNSSLS